MWRSLVAHLTGGQGVAGSNPVIPTVFSQVSNLEPFGLAVAREDSAGNLRVREPFRAQQGGGAVLGLFCRGSPGPGDDRRCDDLPTGTARPAGEDLSMSVEQGATRAVRVDAHQHFWDPTTADYPWMSDAPDVVRPVGPADDVRGVRHPRVVRGRRVPEVLVGVHSYRARRAALPDAHAEILSGRTRRACREIIAPPVIARHRRTAAEQPEDRPAALLSAERLSDAKIPCGIFASHGEPEGL